MQTTHIKQAVNVQIMHMKRQDVIAADGGHVPFPIMGYRHKEVLALQSLRGERHI